MKTLTLYAVLGSAVCLGAAASFGADTIPPMSLAVTDSGGKVVHRSQLKADGSFVTPKLQPGSYVVQFNSKDASAAAESFAVLAKAGNKRVSANAVPGSQFTGGGVAMKLEVPGNMNIVGQVANAEVTGGTGNAKVKIVNGRRYVWVSHGGIGSNLGGRWEEEGVSNRHNAHSMSADAMRRVQDNLTPHQEGYKDVSGASGGGGLGR